MLRFTTCILSCASCVFISVAHIIIKAFMFQKLQFKKEKAILKSRYGGCCEIIAEVLI